MRRNFFASSFHKQTYREMQQKNFLKSEKLVKFENNGCESKR